MKGPTIAAVLAAGAIGAGVTLWIRGPDVAAGSVPSAAPSDEVAELRARVTELEGELARARDELRERRVEVDAAPPAEQASARSAARAAAVAWLGQLSPDRFGALTAEQLDGIRDLDLSELKLAAEDLHHLRALDALARLDLRATGIGDAEMAALRGLDLEALDLGGALITDAGLQHLAGMARLRKLSLADVAVGDLGLASLAHLTSLQSLGLDGTRVTDAGLAALAHLPLAKLEIGRTGIGDTGLATIEKFELDELSLYRNTHVTDAGLRHLASQGQLRTLNLRGINVGAGGLAHLTGLAALEELNASMVMDDAGMAHLRGLKSLKKLGLYSNPEITDAGLAHLRELEGLEFLQLQFTKVTDGGLALLGGLPALRFLDVRGTGVTAKGRDAFRASKPGCRVLR